MDDANELRTLAALEVRAAQARLHALIGDERARRTLSVAAQRILELRERYPDYRDQPAYKQAKRQFVEQARVPPAARDVIS